MVAQFGDFDFDDRPTRTARYLVTARDAIDDRGRRLRRALAADRRGGRPRHLARVRRSCSRRPRSTPATPTAWWRRSANVPGARRDASPEGGGTNEGLTAQIITGDDAAVDALVDGYQYDISAITDDRPFFWHFTPYDDVVTNFSRGLENSEIAIGERLLLMLLAVAVVVAAVLLVAAVPDQPPPWWCAGGERARALAPARVLRGARAGLHARRDLDDPALRAAARVPDAVAVGLAVHAADRHRDRRALLRLDPARHRARRLLDDARRDVGGGHRLPRGLRPGDRAGAGVERTARGSASSS